MRYFVYLCIGDINLHAECSQLRQQTGKGAKFCLYEINAKQWLKRRLRTFI